MQSNESAILAQFKNWAEDFNRSFYVLGEKYNIPCLYIPGTRKNKVLLVAHLDTVWGNKVIQPAVLDNIIFSSSLIRNLGNDISIKKSNGIGADDRAGIAALWMLKDSGHSILISNAEEIGCVGANMISRHKKFFDNLQTQHQFAIEFDRHGKDDLVFYDISTPEFEHYCEEETGYTTNIGSYSDISILCRDICGVNISIGYNDEHSCHETLNIKWFDKTVETTRKWLSKENIPRFERSSK